MDSINKLDKVLQGRVTPSGLPSPPSQPRRMTATTTAMVDMDDVNCVQMQYPDSSEASAEEELVTQHCKTAACNNDNIPPTVALPD